MNVELVWELQVSLAVLPPNAAREFNLFALPFGQILAGAAWVSGPGELHPEALAELYVSLATHTAPIMEPRRTPICQ